MVKYYNPHVDELYHGFEYVKNNQTNIFNINQTQEILNDINNINVKYLDADDIISVGFDLIAEASNNTKIFRCLVNEGIQPVIVELELKYEGDYPFICIYEGKRVLLLNMLCLNKSELQWILRRFQII